MKRKAYEKKIDWKKTWRNNRYMLGLIWKSRPGILVMTFLRAILTAVNSFLVGTYLYQYALNALQSGVELDQILLTLGMMLGYTLFCMIFINIDNRYKALQIPTVEAYIQKQLQEKAMSVELACFERPEFYDIYVKATGEAANRAFAVMNDLSDVIWIVTNVAAVGTLMATIDPIFLLFACLPLIVTLLVGKYRNRLQYQYNMEKKEVGRRKDYVRRTFYLKDFSKEMRLTQMWSVMFRQMHDSVAELKEIVSKYGYSIMWLRYLFDFVFDILVYTGTIILAVFETVVTGRMLIGDCFVVINSISNIAGNINYAGSVFMKLDANSLYIDNLRAFLDYDIQIPEDRNAPVVPSMRTLTLHNVGLTYDGQSAPALQHIDMQIHAGEKIAIVGHNGAGKTTLVKLLLRLYDPDEGEILINGENIKGYRLSSYRNLFGTVFQDYRLFGTSVAENVLLRGLGSEDDRKSVQNALKKSGIAEKIASLSQGMDTIVTKEFDPNGAVFSGGEAQKLSIARVFAGNQEIVILDEPTSALDPIAEQEMYRNMFAACEGKTVILISHRLSSAASADRVYLFEHGEIVEQGTHSGLLALNGKYADMWHKQADTYNMESGVPA